MVATAIAYFRRIYTRHVFSCACHLCIVPSSLDKVVNLALLTRGCLDYNLCSYDPYFSIFYANTCDSNQFYMVPIFFLECRKSFSEFDPRLVAPTCLYLASKAEESTVQAKLLVFYTKKIRQNFLSLFPCKPATLRYPALSRKF